MTNEEMLRRIRNGEDVQHVIEIQSAEQRDEFRAWMLKWSETNPAARTALEHFDARMRDLATGVTGARSVWHSISQAQRRALESAEQHGGRLDRVGIEYRHCARHQPYLPIYVRTLRPLCSRDLFAWDGGAFDPESAVVLTERGRFVLARGRTNQ